MNTSCWQLFIPYRNKVSSGTWNLMSARRTRLNLPRVAYNFHSCITPMVFFYFSTASRYRLPQHRSTSVFAVHKRWFLLFESIRRLTLKTRDTHPTWVISIIIHRFWAGFSLLSMRFYRSATVWQLWQSIILPKSPTKRIHRY